jgi:hypothetical protein
VKHPGHKSLDDFDKTLQEESEELLLDRNYIYWCKDEQKYKSIKIRSIIESGYEQLCKYIKVISKGKAYHRVGVLDNRITIESGLSYIRGYLIASFGTQRVMVKSIVKTSNYQYFNKNYE